MPSQLSAKRSDQTADDPSQALYSTATDTASFEFLRLPKEIRLMVYECLSYHVTPLKKLYPVHEKPPRVLFEVVEQLDCTILRTCRTVHEEALPIISRNTYALPKAIFMADSPENFASAVSWINRFALHAGTLRPMGKAKSKPEAVEVLNSLAGAVHAARKLEIAFHVPHNADREIFLYHLERWIHSALPREYEIVVTIHGLDTTGLQSLVVGILAGIVCSRLNVVVQGHLDAPMIRWKERHGFEDLIMNSAHINWKERYGLEELGLLPWF